MIRSIRLKKPSCSPGKVKPRPTTRIAENTIPTGGDVFFAVKLPPRSLFLCRSFLCRIVPLGFANSPALSDCHKNNLFALHHYSGIYK